MLASVLIVLLLTSRAASYTFTGGTENGSFICHCWEDVQCDHDTGACPLDRCYIGWNSPACQYAFLAQTGSTAVQTGDSSHVAGRCIDNDTNRDITQGSCCNPRRTNGELSWSVDLGGTFAIKSIIIATHDGDVYSDTVRGVEVYLSASRNSTDAELCGVQRGYFYRIFAIYCHWVVSRYVTIRQPNVTIEEMVFCEIYVEGYEYYPCGFYDGDYRYGPACLENCHCKHQCDVITGVCDGDCAAGWKKNYKGVCLEACSPAFCGENCEYNCDVITGVYDDGCTPEFGDVYCHPCKCLYASEVCDATTGSCESDCDVRYMGVGCNVVKPSLRESTITFTEEKDVIIITISDIEYRTELVSEYVVQYKPLYKDTFKSITLNPISGRRRREVGEDEVVLQIPFSDISINTRYQFVLIPLISSPEYKGGVGVPSEITHYNSGCLQYTGLLSCNRWCVCRNDPSTLCLLICDYCDVCDSESELPSGENVNFKITDITTNSLRIQFMDAHPDLPFISTFLTRLGDHHVNISSSMNKTDYTFCSLKPNTTYDIDITAALEDGVLSKSWALTATTLTESSDNSGSSDHILPIVVGCVVPIAGIVALSVVIGILLKRRKTRQSQEEEPQQQQSEEQYDYIAESSIRDSSQIADNGQIALVEQLEK